MLSLFVYGTLKRGGANHRQLLGQRFVGAARTSPLFRLYDLDGYPGMVAVAGGGRSIEGEIWEVDPHCLARLDQFEGVGVGLFGREPIGLLSPHDSRPIQAYLYRRSVVGRRELGACYP